jgi:tetrahydromethanopterin S-methyltransferase subunit G
MKRDRDSRPNISEDDYNELLRQLEEINQQVLSLTDEKENFKQKLDNIPAN